MLDTVQGQIWEVKVYSRNSNEPDLYWFDNAANVIKSVNETWKKCPNEIRRLNMADPNIMAWDYREDSKAAITAVKRDLRIHHDWTHF
jgi:hypothetical protein